MINPQPVNLSEPVLIDAVLQKVNTAFAGLSWLSNAYGRAEKQVKVKNKKEYTYPAVNVGGKEYLTVFPDEHLKNHSFWHIEKQQLSRDGASISAEFRLIFWYDLRTVYPDDWQTRSNENPKSEVLKLLRQNYPTPSTIELTGFQDEAKEIYAGYSDTQLQTQFLMRPYGGFALTGIIKYRENKC